MRLFCVFNWIITHSAGAFLQAFGNILNLVPLAESVVKLNAVCMQCFKEAAYTKRIGAEKEVRRRMKKRRMARAQHTCFHPPKPTGKPYYCCTFIVFLEFPEILDFFRWKVQNWWQFKRPWSPFPVPTDTSKHLRPFAELLFRFLRIVSPPFRRWRWSAEQTSTRQCAESVTEVWRWTKRTALPVGMKRHHKITRKSWRTWLFPGSSSPLSSSEKTPLILVCICFFQMVFPWFSISVFLKWSQSTTL